MERMSLGDTRCYAIAVLNKAIAEVGEYGHFATECKVNDPYLLNRWSGHSPYCKMQAVLEGRTDTGAYFDAGVVLLKVRNDDYSIGRPWPVLEAEVRISFCKQEELVEREYRYLLSYDADRGLEIVEGPFNQ